MVINMDIGLILRIVGVGVLVCAACQVLKGAGRDEQAMMVSVAGVVMVLLLLVGQIGELFDSVREVFGL